MRKVVLINYLRDLAAMVATPGMNTFEEAMRLMAWSESLLIPPFFVFAVAAILSLAISYLTQRPFRNPLWKREYWLISTHFVFFFLITWIGLVWWGADVGPQPASSKGENLLDFVFACSLLSCAWWTWRMKGLRWFGASLLAVLELPIIGAVFVASMAVTGDWL